MSSDSDLADACLTYPRGEALGMDVPRVPELVVAQRQDVAHVIMGLSVTLEFDWVHLSLLGDSGKDEGCMLLFKFTGCVLSM